MDRPRSEFTAVYPASTRTKVLSFTPMGAWGIPKRQHRLLLTSGVTWALGPDEEQALQPAWA